jgi:hypothetical protein
MTPLTAIAEQLAATELSALPVFAAGLRLCRWAWWGNRRSLGARGACSHPPRVKSWPVRISSIRRFA